MILPFKQYINGKPTLFHTKIHSSLTGNDFENRIDTTEFFSSILMLLQTVKYLDRLIPGEVSDFQEALNEREYLKPKHHTIREDKNDRWKAGMNIHFTFWNRTKRSWRFAPVVPVKHIQAIDILYYEDEDKFPRIMIFDRPDPFLVLDIKPGDSNYIEEVTRLAHNDGFDTMEEFLAYFNKDFHGKIIHWTDLTY